MTCDFCEEESATCGFDPEWDAVICDRCKAELLRAAESAQEPQWATDEEYQREWDRNPSGAVTEPHNGKVHKLDSYNVSWRHLTGEC